MFLCIYELILCLRYDDSNDMSAYLSVIAAHKQSNFEFIILGYIGKKGVVENLD